MSVDLVRLNAALEGRYTIERELGEGGMAVVFLAEDLKHDRRVTQFPKADTSTGDLAPDGAPIVTRTDTGSIVNWHAEFERELQEAAR